MQKKLKKGERRDQRDGAGEMRKAGPPEVLQTRFLSLTSILKTLRVTGKGFKQISHLTRTVYSESSWAVWYEK